MGDIFSHCIWVSLLLVLHLVDNMFLYHYLLPKFPMKGRYIKICFIANIIPFFFYRIRGILGSFLTFLLYLGILVSFIIGTFVPFHLVPYIMLSFPIIFLLCMVFFVPESPQFLMSIDNNEKVCGTNKTESLGVFINTYLVIPTCPTSDPDFRAPKIFFRGNIKTFYRAPAFKIDSY